MLHHVHDAMNNKFWEHIFPNVKQQNYTYNLVACITVIALFIVHPDVSPPLSHILHALGKCLTC